MQKNNFLADFAKHLAVEPDEWWNALLNKAKKPRNAQIRRCCSFCQIFGSWVAEWRNALRRNRLLFLSVASVMPAIQNFVIICTSGLNEIRYSSLCNELYFYCNRFHRNKKTGKNIMRREKNYEMFFIYLYPSIASGTKKDTRNETKRFPQSIFQKSIQYS